MKTYLITSGSFKLDDGTIKNAGETIELPDDVAEANKHLLRAVEDGEQQPQGHAE